MALIVEFTVEPFTEGAPGPHVRAAVEVAQAAGLAVEFGPFGTTVEGDDVPVLDAVDEIVRAAVAAGASRVSLQLTNIQGASVSNIEDPMKSFNSDLITEFRANDGKVSGPFEQAPLVLVTAKGAKSGTPRTFPIVHTRDGDDLVIIASKGGADTNPDWYYNLKANPDVEVELPGDTFSATATEVTGAERDRLYAAQAALMDNFNEYAAKTTRVIPVFRLSRR